jgi:hypothetical protein
MVFLMVQQYYNPTMKQMIKSIKSVNKYTSGLYYKHITIPNEAPKVVSE